MCRLRTAFRGTDANQTIQAVSAIERSRKTTPSGKQLCTLAKKLLTGPAYSGKGKSWSYAGIRCCILTVARRFALQRQDKDPAGYRKTTLEELYRLTVDEAAEDSISPQGLQATVAWALRQYHRHLVFAYGASTIDEGVAFRVAPGSDPADAHVLSVDEIFQVIEHIEASRNRRWKKLYRTVALGQIVLDFLGGLRRAEGLGLLPSDLLPGPLCGVRVRDNDIRTLKTENAYRQVVLGALAHPFSELLDHVYALFREAGELGTDLSCGVSEDVIVPIIHDALRAVTRVEDCHLHTLRHSAAHWMFMRLMVADLDRVPDLFPHLPKTTLWLKASHEVRSLLLHNSGMNDHAWAVAVMMGHSNPDKVTLRYYVHCLDLLLALFLAARTKLGAAATAEELRSLSGLPHSTAYHRLPAPTEQNANSNLIAPIDCTQGHDKSCHEPEKEFVLKIFCDRLGLSVHSNCHPSPPAAHPDFWPKDTYDMLWMSYELGLSADRLASIFGLGRQDVVAMLSRADSFLRIRGYQPKVLRNGKVPDGAHVESPKVPRPPKIGFDSKAFKIWSIELENYVVSHHDHTTTALGYMVSNMLPEFAKTVFAGAPQSELMQSCLGVFDALGFQRDDLDAITCDGTTNVKPSRKWLQRWGLSWRITATNQSGLGRLLRVPPPWVAVGPKSPEETAALSLRQQAEAIWFLIRMAAVRFAA